METTEELKIDEVQALKDRTTQLYEVMEMCKNDKVALQLCRNDIIELNIRLVPHVLKKYRPYGDDEFQLGCVGLIIAADTFDPARGVPFPSYACFCIERELHKAHKQVSNTFEYLMKDSLSSLDEMFAMENGDETEKHDIIPDAAAEKEFDQIVEDNDLDNLFENTIIPAIDSIAKQTKGQVTTVDFELWKKLELRYILEMAQVDSQKARVTLSAIARELGVSVQNTRIRHQRVIDAIKSKCIESGIHC